MKTSIIPGFGRINWAEISPRGTLCRVATNRGVFHAEAGAGNSIFLCPDSDGDEKRTYTVSGHFCGPNNEIAQGRHAFRFYVRPGFRLNLLAQTIDPDAAAKELRFGREDAHEFESKGASAVKQRVSDWRRALAAGGMRLTRRAPRFANGTYFEEHNEDSQGSLLFNRITGYHQTAPEGDMALDDGFYFSHSGVWAGAASDEKLPDWELRLFFAGLTSWQRRAIAQKLAAHSLNCRPAGRHWDGEFGVEVTELPRPNGRYSFRRFQTVDPMRDCGDDGLSEAAQNALSEAGLYLSTLVPGRTRQQDGEVLKELQRVECGLARFARPEDQVRAWSIVDAGGSLSIAGHNHGTRLLKLLKLSRHTEVRRAVLQRRWQKLLTTGKIRWEANEVFTLAADFGIARYPSRHWVAEALNRKRAERRKSAAQQREHARRLRADQEKRDRKIAARREDDRFCVVAKNASRDHYELRIERDGATVETYTVCREGTRLFCSRTGCNPRRSYSRAELRERIAAILLRQEQEAWVASHNFAGLFRELGVSAAA